MMSESEESLMARASQAQIRLIELLADNPDVELIDIGRDPREHASSKKLVLRVHVRRALTLPELGLADEIDGVPVTTVIADYIETEGRR